VGIGGATRSGKSTLAKQLVAHFGSPSALCLDRFFKQRELMTTYKK